MQHLIRAVQTRLKQRRLYRQAVGLLVKDFCKSFAVDPSSLQIKLYGTLCTILLGSQEDKTIRYLQKAHLLERINKKLADDGREVQFDEVRIK